MNFYKPNHLRYCKKDYRDINLFLFPSFPDRSYHIMDAYINASVIWNIHSINLFKRYLKGIL